MARLGEALRAQRERMGITLEQAAEDTRIRDKFLRALEGGDYQTLPGVVYTKGFLRNYADYLGLDPEQLIAQFQAERGAPDAPRSFEPMRPIMRRSVILTPAVLVPISVLAAVALFVAYLYYQFTTFAVPPRIEIAEPAGDAIAQSADYLIRGRTAPDARITIRVSPGPEIISDVRPTADGSFSVRVPLKPGANHVEVQVFDAAGKQNQASRVIRYEAAAQPSPAGAPPDIRLLLTQPAEGAAVTNAPVTVSGSVAAGSTVTVNGRGVTAEGGTFSTALALPAGAQVVTVSVQAPGGSVATITRTVNVSYTAALVTVRVQGGDAWLQVVVDGAQSAGTGRVFAAGQTLTFTGQQVFLRSGNAGATFVSVNGRDLGALGGPGQVVERVFTQ